MKSLRSRAVKAAPVKQKVAPRVAKPIKKVKLVKKKAAKNSKKEVKAVAKPGKKIPPKTDKKVAKAAQPKKEAKKPAAVKKVKQPKQPKDRKGYPGYMYMEFKNLVRDLSQNSSIQALKDELKKNFQSMTGNKTFLAQKVADGRLLGRILRCPKCFGGRPRFDQNENTFYCPGYRDDTDFKNCHSTFTAQQFKRGPWEK